MSDLRKTLLEAYEHTNAANRVVFGFYMNGKRDVYAVKMDRLPIDFVVMSCERSSKGKARKLKIGELSDVKRAKLMAMGAAYVGTTAEVMGDAKNRGDAFESYIAKHWYGKNNHKKDCIAYWKKADIDAGAEQIQVKFEFASLATEQTIMNGLEALKA